jgi:hypothetical protein
MLNCGAIAPVIPAPVGVAAAVNVTAPLVDAFQAHVAVKLDPEPIANLFLQPGNTLPFELKEIFDATVTVAVITIDVLKVVVVAAPASWNSENAEVSTTFVTVIVIA